MDEDAESMTQSQGSSRSPRISRRQLLSGAAGTAVLAGAGAVGYAWPRSSPAPAVKSATAPSSGVATKSSASSFRSRPDLIPPRLQVTSVAANPGEGVILLTPSALPGARGVDEQAALNAGLGQEGAMIVDERGEVVWFLPTHGTATNLQVQMYDNKPVLTYWAGEITNGIGAGDGFVLDSSYKTVKTIKAGNGLRADLHELTLTTHNTALISAYALKDANLSSVGGPKHGGVFDSVIQEIDLTSGKVVFEWHSLDHVPLSESYAKPVAGKFDYFHINSIAEDGNNLLISARNTWTVYRIDRSSGAIAWRLNGKKSDFTMGSGTRFAWQHHARRSADGNISIFDDGAAPAVETESRAIILNVDETRKRAKLVKAYTHPAHLLSSFEGSAQVLPNGHMFVGWGGEPYATEFTADGSLVLDMRFPTNAQSYRGFRSPWRGQPTEVPAVVVEKDALSGFALYVSWNGATDVASWRVLSGKSPSKLVDSGIVPKSGFETAVTVHPKGPYLAVAGLDASGSQLGISKTIRTPR